MSKHQQQQRRASGLHDPQGQHSDPQTLNTLLHLVSTDLTELKKTVTLLVNDNISLKNTISAQEKRLRLSEGMIAQLRSKITQQEDEITDLKCRSMRDNIVIRGIAEDNNETWDATKTKVVRFLQETMQVNTSADDIDRAHRLGQKSNRDTPRPIVAKLNSSDAKSAIFKNVKKLKDKPDISIQDQLPPEVQERRKRLWPKYKEARENPANNVKWAVDKLIINGRVHTAKDEMPQIDPESDIDDSIEVKQTQHVTEMGSTFIGHAAYVSKNECIPKVLANILQDRLVGSATHNIFAYRIGRATNIKEGCSDDGEHGAGTMLLKMLQTTNATNVMVVVSRFYGGQNLGPLRFEVIKNCATRAIDLLK